MDPYREDDDRGPDPRRDSRLSRVAYTLCLVSALATACSWASCGLVTEDGTGPLTAYLVGLGLTAALWIAGHVVQRIAHRRLALRPELSGVHRVRVAATMRTLSGVALLVLVSLLGTCYLVSR